RRSATRVISDKEEAKTNLQRAILAWESAIQIDPSLTTLQGGDLQFKLKQAKVYLANLLAGPPPLPPTRTQSR
ncbi:MAG: hypothetical protein V2A74_01610, partial [bacterium]